MKKTILFCLFALMATLHAIGGNPTPQVVWCGGNTTLYFLYDEPVGETYKGQAVTNVWSGDDAVLKTGTSGPVWADIESPFSSACTKVVFEPSFALVRPQKTARWFNFFDKLTTIEGIEYLNMSAVTETSCMFYGCQKLTTINVDFFDMHLVEYASSMFEGCSSLETIYCGSTWNVRTASEMFEGCVKLENFNENQMNGDMANPTTGYFTAPEAQLFQGEGTQTTPYLINSVLDWNRLAAKVNNGESFSEKYFQLTQDLEFNSNEILDNYSPVGCRKRIGDTDYANYYFQGIFDGNGHSLSSIYVLLEGTGYNNSYVGVFGMLGEGGVVRNLTLSHSTIRAYDFTGGIVGYNSKGTIENCHVTKNVSVTGITDGVSAHGGIVGKNDQGTVSGCTCAGDVNASFLDQQYAIGDGFGGIAGYNDGTITGCRFYGDNVALSFFSTESTNMGAIVGTNDGNVTDCLFICNSTEYKTVGKGNGTVTHSGLAYGIQLAENVTIVNDALSYDGKCYALPGDYVTFSYSGTVPEGKNVIFVANAGLDTEVRSRRNGQLTMPGCDVVVTYAFVDALQPSSVINETQLNDAIADGANIVLGDNISLTGRVVIDAPVAVSIDLNGYTLSRGNPTEANGDGHALIIGGGANVTIKDSRTGGTITGGNADAGGGIWIGPRGTVTLQSGTITACRATGNGGAIYNKGTLTINGGSISDNTAGDGGGIYNEEGATLTFADGSITGNTSTVHGGAGISNHGTLTVSGGTVSGNTSVGNGSGIWTGGEKSTLYMEGNPVVTDNQKGNDDHNLYVSQGKVINVTGAFTQGTNIGLTLGGSQTLTSGYGTHNGTTDLNIFHLDGNLNTTGTISLVGGEVIYVLGEYVTDVMIAVGKGNKNTKVNEEGWTAIEKDLNAGAGGSYVYLLYKTNKSTGSSGRPITDFYLKTGNDDALSYNGRSYSPATGVGGTNLNYGNDGTKIYLLYTKDAFDDGRAVTSISINGTASGAVTRDDTGAACDLNRGAGGQYIYMHADYPQVDNFPYVVRRWDATNKKVVEETYTKTISELTRLDGSINELANGWYVVDNNVTYNSIIEIMGNDVNIIVADGMKLNASEGIRIPKDSKLKIYGQSAGTGLVYAHANAGPGIGGRGDIYVGRLEIHGGTIDAQSGSKKNAGIGSGNGQNAGFQSITIYGGTVKAKGGSEAAGIGSGRWNHENNIGPIYIYGGTVYANGGANGAGIGSGGNESGGFSGGGNGPIYINGGSVYATGGENGPGIGSGYDGHVLKNISIYGAYVIATGSKNADGIGGAASQASINSTVTIENSTVKAIGKSNKSGIKCYNLSIKNSVVEAKSDKTYYKFIRVTSGGYDERNFPFMTNLMRDYMGDGLMLLYGNAEPDAKWNNSYVWGSTYPTAAAEGARYVKIMPCDHEGATCTDNGDGTHKVSCNNCKNAKNEAHTIISTGSGYCCSKCYCEAERPNESYYSVGKITYDGTDYQGAAYYEYLSPGAEYSLPDCTNPDGYAFAGWAVVHNLSKVGTSPLPLDDETLYPAGYQLPLTGNIILVARYHSTNLFLSDDESNESLLVMNMNNNSNVTLKGRTLWKDDSWNTLCLPFDIALVGSPLEGAVLKELDVEGYYDGDGNHYTYHIKDGDEDQMETGYYDDVATPYGGEASSLHQTGFDATTGTLTLYFRDVTSIEAGKPYIIKWATVNPNYFEPSQFTGVTISSIAPSSTTSADGKLTFTGTYAPVEIGSTGDDTKLFLGANNNLYWPDAAMTIGCQRAYFQLNGLTAGEPNNQTTNPQNGQVRAFVLNFGDSEASGIKNVQCSMVNVQSNNAWYDMSGRRLNGKPTRAGVYIHNGTKVVMK